MPSRRSILAAVGSTAALLASPPLSRRVFAEGAAPAPAAPAPAGPFKLPPLPYAYDALEPSIDKTTMELHHAKHHAAYVNNLNTAAKTAPQIADVPLETLLANLGSVPEGVRTAVRNNAGGDANHIMFWQVMGPRTGTSGDTPSGEVAEAIARDLGGMDAMRQSFDTAGTKLFGSGWVFVTVTPEGKLALETRPNQDTPLMDGKRVLFGNDVWEHAYYLKYQNRRAEYLKAWWNTVNWGAVGARYAAAKAGTLTI